MSDTNAQTVSYVRETMLPESAPPATERGVVKWMRENLFSSWLNAILTILSIYVIYLILAGVLPWLLNSVWSAGSLNECREVLAAQGMTSHDGACFSVLTARWHQLVFGYYPSELYWRPILAIVIFLIGILPVLFQSVSRKLLIVTALVPFVCFWLLWGGSVWFPITIALGFVIGYFAMKIVGNLLRYPSCPRASVGPVHHQDICGDLYRSHPWCAADRVAVYSAIAAELLPAAGHQL